MHSQVHACNILRALYRETKLGEDVFPFVSDGIAVAITGFYSDSWAVSRLSCTTGIPDTALNFYCYRYRSIDFLPTDLYASGYFWFKVKSQRHETLLTYSQTRSCVYFVKGAVSRFYHDFEVQKHTKILHNPAKMVLFLKASLNK